MPIAKHELGVFGERIVAKTCECPRCKRSKTLIRLPTNFKCADLICDFCGYLAQVKSATSRDIAKLPNTLLGAAWKPQKQRMDAAIYFPLYIVLANADLKKWSIFYLAADLQPQNLLERESLFRRVRAVQVGKVLLTILIRFGIGLSDSFEDGCIHSALSMNFGLG